MILNGDRPTAGSRDIYDVVGGQILIATPLRYLWRMLAVKHGIEDPGDDEGRQAALAPQYRPATHPHRGRRSGGWHTVDDPGPSQFSDAECGVRGRAPYRGEHNAEVLQDWLGRSAAEATLLVEAGVLAHQERPS